MYKLQIKTHGYTLVFYPAYNEITEQAYLKFNYVSRHNIGTGHVYKGITDFKIYTITDIPASVRRKILTIAQDIL